MHLSWEKDRKQHTSRGGANRRYEITYQDGPLGLMFSATMYVDGTTKTQRNLGSHGGGSAKDALIRAYNACQREEDAHAAGDAAQGRAALGEALPA